MAACRVTSMVASWVARKTTTTVHAAAPAAAARAFGTAPKLATVDAAAVAEHATAAETAASAKPAVRDLSDTAVLHLLKAGLLSPHRLEADLTDASRAVTLRRAFIADTLAKAVGPAKTATNPTAALTALPAGGFDTDAFYRSILNTNCEAVIGYVPLPVGIVGPLALDGRSFYVPMATTEGALVASTNRGCAAIRRAGGATTALMGDGMTRAPLVRVESLAEAAKLRAWLEVPTNFAAVAAAFNSTSRFGRLQSVTAATAGRNVYLRFKASTGDAMGMNMITKGVNEALALLARHFPSMRVMSLSGNMCTDKKPSAVNWIEGRGKSVSAEVRLSGHVLKSVLKTSADAMVELNTAKNLVGSALAGSVGGFNAHASNIVTAVYLATGQDPAQNVESSTCLTLMEKDATIADAADPEGKAGAGIVMTVTMPSVEVGTVGGGTSLPAQAACLELLGLRGSHATTPGANAQQLARVVAGSVLAGELSLMSALTTNDLLSSHLKLNRKPAAGEGAGGGFAAVSDAMLAKLREAAGHASVAAAAAAPEGGVAYRTVYTPATTAVPSVTREAVHGGGAAAAGAASLSPAGHVPGGAPAGSHPHPLHMTAAHAGAAATASPGRRYFAAPTSRVSRVGMAGAALGPVTSTATARALPFTLAHATGAAIAPGVDEESRFGGDADDSEPRLSVP